MHSIRQVCVYCASSSQIDEKYFVATREIARQLVRANITVVYGGGSSGLMGQLADTVLEEKGRIVGIMPQFMKEVEWAHKGVKEFHFVGDMHERKKRFLDGTDALITLPGGCGTLEELLEAITLKRLGLFTNPIAIVNVEGYFDPLIEMLNRTVEERFMSEQHRQMWSVVNDPQELLPALAHATPWHEDAIRHARVKG